ncbi:MAG TPA: glucose-6-phosphate isomerase [Methanococcaceae archaeon]|uniref:Probable glucose-6-phosphate isomerase n=1 Tax=Methanothermococcus okinawensis TaxID=155863 RepID=A0A833E4Y0_9EURY|nr:glucose-6-phosphate isomerase [Methanococcaceae archaeon]HIP91039.1 glucose-6-phosphate isomerase [Methanothermococcus okinawensis]
MDYFKYTNVMREKLGREGLSLEDMEGIGDMAYRRIMEKYDRGELGFMEVIYRDIGEYSLNHRYREFKYILVIGMGGSILGTQAIYEGVKGIYANELNEKKVFFLDNSDPELLYSILKIVDLKETLVFVVSKSGNTVETLANFFILKEMMEKKGCGKDNIVIISSGGVLKEIGEREDYQIFEIPENVVGRFSVLSSVGLVPLSAMGVDIERLISGARDMDKICRRDDLFKNPALMNALIHHLFLNRGKSISVLMPYMERLYRFSMWYRQLWAESLGKNGKGQTPVAALGAKDQHSQLQLYLDGPRDKIITFIRVKRFREDFNIRYRGHYLEDHTLSQLINLQQLGTERALTARGVPNLSIVLKDLDEYTLGKLIYMYEMTTAFMGEMLGVNAFDQPAVEEGKRITRELLEGRAKGEEVLEEYVIKI